MQLPDLKAIERASNEVYQFLQPTPMLQWPLLSQRCARTVWTKHENHNPTGAFKIRGGLIYLKRLKQRQPELQGVVTATRGNHGQSIAFAAAQFGLKCVVVVPEGNSEDKNRAMRALGAEVVVHGRDFDQSIPHSALLAEQYGYHKLPSIHKDLILGVSTYALETLKYRPELARIYVPIGLGSGICGMIAARNALGLKTDIVGVVSARADAYARSVEAKRCVATETANTIADGMAVRQPSAEALKVITDNVDRIVRVEEEEIMFAIATIFSDTHNVVEGAGAAGLAALLKEVPQLPPQEESAVIFTGGNIDAELYTRALLNPETR
jgi:threonine dehydratase